MPIISKINSVPVENLTYQKEQIKILQLSIL